MEKIEVEELKKIQVKILNYVDDFCKKNNINYWLDSGTLLGAVRHKGFIPWDDDIDLGMLREDYNKFMEFFNKDNNSNYKFCCYENNKKWPYPYGKILNTNTIMYEPDEKYGIKSSVFVDLFPYDNIPQDDKEREKAFKKRNLYKKLNNLQRYKSFYIESKNRYNFIRYPFHLLMKLFPEGYFIKKSIENSKMYNNKESNLVGNFTGTMKQWCDKDVFNSFIELEFEGRKYPAPVGYDKWLTSFYGDYMKLPPIEKRVSHHRFIAYYK